jgi:glycosyltransferase involved in cell wall biosynthesis
MDLSVVITALNGRSALPATLDSLAEHLPSAEVIVANGPSADGTSGLVADHQVVDTVLELSERNPNVARNAGLAVASEPAVAFLGQGSRIEATWPDAVAAALASDADAVTGPIHRELGADLTTESFEETRIGSRWVRYFDAGNVVFDRDAIDALDGFDERLEVEAGRDAAHRLAGLDRRVEWHPEAAVLRTATEDGPQTPVAEDVGQSYRARGYRMTKNYGPGWLTARYLLQELVADGFDETKAAIAGETPPSAWLGDGRQAVGNLLAGTGAGLLARFADRTPRRNPNGLSARGDRPVSRTDF